MKDIKIGTVGVILVMLLISVSVVYSQNDNAIINDLLEKRKILVAEMNAEILVKDAFDKTSAAKNSPSATEFVFTGADGRVLKEEYDASKNLIKDTFTDPKYKMELTTEYAVNKGVICRTLLNNAREDKLKVCNSCPLIILPPETPDIQKETFTYGAFQDQTVWDLITGNILRIKLNCCGDLLEKILEQMCPVTKQSEI